MRGVLTGLLLCGSLAFSSNLTGQVIPDSTRVPPDSLRVLTPDDTLGLQEVPPDSINPADTLPAVQLPNLVETLPEGWHTAVWDWDREEILASKARQVPQAKSPEGSRIPTFIPTRRRTLHSLLRP